MEQPNDIHRSCPAGVVSPAAALSISNAYTIQPSAHSRKESVGLLCLLCLMTNSNSLRILARAAKCGKRIGYPRNELNKSKTFYAIQALAATFNSMPYSDSFSFGMEDFIAHGPYLCCSTIYLNSRSGINIFDDIVGMSNNISVRMNRTG